MAFIWFFHVPEHLVVYLIGQETEKSILPFSNLGNLESLDSKKLNNKPKISHRSDQNNQESNLTDTSLDKNQTLISDKELEFLLFGSITEDTIKDYDEAEHEAKEKIKLNNWLPSVSASFGYGFSDNPMYGPYLRESSTYFEFETESFFLRQANSEFLSYIYFFGEGKRFFDLDRHKLTGIALIQGEHTYKPKNMAGSWGAKIRHTYYDQSFDFSDLGLPFSMQVQSNKSEIVPHFGYELSSNFKLSSEASFGIDRYDNPSENNSDQKMMVTLSNQPNKDNTLYAKIFHHSIRYMDRKRKDTDGIDFADGNLKTKKMGISGSWKKESENPWIHSLGVEFKYSQLSDNAGAYYDYDKISAKLSHEIKWEKWKSLTELGWSNYFYDQRSVLPGIKFKRQSFAFDFLISRKISSDWDAYFKWRFEEDESNVRDYEYYTNFWALGIKWEN